MAEAQDNFSETAPPSGRTAKRQRHEERTVSKRVTIPESLAEQLQAEADERGVSFSRHLTERIQGKVMTLADIQPE